jgi:hypothetical protein
MVNRISELPAASEAIAGNDLIAVSNVSEPGTGETQKFTQDELLASQLKLNFRTAAELTISGGAVTKTQAWHTIDTEGDAASDDLDTINDGADGDVIFFRPENDARTIVVKHGTGNILCVGGSDFSLDDEEDFCVGIYDAGIAAWLVMFPASGGGISPSEFTQDGGVLVGTGAGTFAEETGATARGSIGAMGELADDATPQLGADLDMNDHGISVNVEPTDDLDYQGIVTTMTVDTNAEGVGAPLFLAADGHLDTADADTIATAPCVALALETGTGSKKVLLVGTLRVDAWNWTIGPGATSLIYLSETVGTLTQTKPVTEDSVIQPVGFALTDDMIMFNPSMIFITHAA